MHTQRRLVSSRSFWQMSSPGDSFLTLQIQLNRHREPHRDHQNASLPSLICNLSPSSPGGTWVEDPEGSLPLECPDGRTRVGRIITGRRYRLSARDLWHASRPSFEDRLLLLGWTPAGWQHIPSADMAGLLSLGICCAACRSRTTRTFIPMGAGQQCPEGSRVLWVSKKALE